VDRTDDVPREVKVTMSNAEIRERDNDLPDAPLASYRDRFPGVARDFSLYPEKIVVRGRHSEFNYALSSIDPAYGVLRSRSEIAGPGALILGGIFGALFLFGLSHGRPEFFPAGAVLMGTIAALCLFTGVRHVRRVEHYVFRSISGVPLFNIARAGPERDRFDEFVQQLVAVIRRGQPPTV
jgi:hypothetical protein